MPINTDNKYYDFEELFFEKNCDITYKEYYVYCIHSFI